MFNFWKKIKRFRNFLFTPVASYKNNQYLYNPIIYKCIELISNCATKIEIENYPTKEWIGFINEAIIEFEVNGNLFISKKDNILYIEKDDNKNCLHIKKMLSISPIETLNKYLHCYESIIEYITAISQNNGRLSGILSQETVISNEEKNRLSNEFLNLKNNSILLLEGNYKWETIGLSPKELDILNMCKYIEKIITSTMGVPPILLGIQDATFSNYEVAFQHLEIFKVKPIIKLIIESCNNYFNTNISIKN